MKKAAFFFISTRCSGTPPSYAHCADRKSADIFTSDADPVRFLLFSISAKILLYQRNRRISFVDRAEYQPWGRVLLYGILNHKTGSSLGSGRRDTAGPDPVIAGWSSRTFSIFVFLWIVAYGILLAFTLGSTRPYQGDESYYTVSAITMVEEGDYLVPYYDGSPRLQKPPLAYWMTALGYRLFGIGLWSARVPFLLTTCCLLYLVYRLSVLSHGDRDQGLLTLLLYSSAPMTIQFSRVAMTDLPLTFFVTASLYFFLDSFADRAWVGRHYRLAFLFMGLAVLSKGYIGMLPLAVMIIYLLLERDPHRTLYLRRLADPLCILILLAIALPWYVYIYLDRPSELLAQTGTEAGAFSAPFGMARAFSHMFYYMGVLVRYFFPFTLIAAYCALQKRTRLPRTSRFLLVAVVSVLLIFVCVVDMQRSRYLLVLFPALAVIVGNIIHRTRWRQPAKTLAIVISALQIGILLAIPRMSGEPVKALVEYWDENLSGTLAVSGMGERERGWAEVLSGGRLVESSGSPDYILTGSEAPWQGEGYRTIRQAERIDSIRFETLTRPVLDGKTYYLMEKPRR